MPRAPIVRPPRIAVWLIELFASAEQVEAIHGDLLEDFSVIASRSGISAARRWYWKQSLKSVTHLIWTGYRTAPWLIPLAIGGICVFRLTLNLPTRVVCGIVFSIPGYYKTHWIPWTFWVNYGVAIGTLVWEALIGCLIGLVAKGKETIATATLGALGIAIFTIPYLFWFAWYVAHWPSSYTRPSGSPAFTFGMVILINAFGHSVMPVIGGGIVRRFRSTAARRPSSA